MKENEVCIVVPVYNAEKYLRECLDSIRRQSYNEWTCICVNDGSTDGSWPIVQEYCFLDKRFVSMSKPNEGSPAKTIRYGVNRADSVFVITIGDDDTISDDYVEKLLKRQKETNADVVVSSMVFMDKSMKEVKMRLPSKTFDIYQVVDGKKACLMTTPDYQIGLNGSLVRKELWCSTTDGSLMNTDELQAREVLVNSSLVAFSTAEYYYRSNPESITKAITPRLFEKTVIEALLVQFAKTYFPDNSELITTMRQRHFSGLQCNIVYFNQIKDRFTEQECLRIESFLAQSYQCIDVWDTMRDSFKWGTAVLLLRRFKWYQALVLYHYRKKKT